MRRLRKGQRGFNVAEVIVATGLLGVVAMSVMTLFFMGRRNVYSGRQMTHAVAVGTRVMEDFSSLNRQMIYGGAFAIAGDATGTSFNIAGRSYANSRIRSTLATIIPSAPSDISTEATGTGAPLFLAKWRTQAEVLGQGASVSVVMTPTEDPTNTPAQFRTGTVLQVRVIVQWLEATRPRSFVLDSVKPY